MHKEKEFEDEFNYFLSACEEGNDTDVLQILKNAKKKKRKILLCFNDCAAFRWACRHGHKSTIQRLWEEADQETRWKLLKALNYAAFRLACRFNQAEIIEHFLSLLGADNLQEMFLACQSEGLIAAYSNEQIIDSILKNSKKETLKTMLSDIQEDDCRWVFPPERRDDIRRKIQEELDSKNSTLIPEKKMEKPPVSSGISK